MKMLLRCASFLLFVSLLLNLGAAAAAADEQGAVDFDLDFDDDDQQGQQQGQQQQEQKQEVYSDLQFKVAKQFEKSVQNVAAGEPSSLWASKSKRKPLPTNKYWQNFVLNRGAAPEFIHPYSIQFANRSLIIGYPKRTATAKGITQVHTADLIVSSVDDPSSMHHSVSRYDDLTITMQLGAMRIPLLRGSPYVTFLFTDGVPAFSSSHSVINASSSFDSRKHQIFLGNGQKWIIYASSPLRLNNQLRSDQSFSGTVRVALVPQSTTSSSASSSAESILDSFSGCYATAARVAYDTSNDSSSPPTISHIYRTEGEGELLLLGLPMHRGLIDYSASNARFLPGVSYSSIDGQLQGIIGSIWKLKSKSPAASIGWHSVAGIRDPAALAKIGVALARDVANLRPIDISSTYFFGKAAARAARLALIAEEIGVPEVVATVANFLDQNLSPWFDGTLGGNAIVYDSKWGGLVSQQGAFDSGADFGLGVYNDHHYHWGYFVYAGAVLAKLDPEWGERYRTNLYSLVGDFMSPSAGSARASSRRSNFPRIRHFDPWVMHSWAGGLTEFADGRNQESTSEAVNAYYAAALLGRAFGDEELVKIGSTLAGFECWGAKSLWHIRSDSDLYEEEFVSSNRVNGVLWANKRDSSLWFACGSSSGSLECRVGIQVIPVTPVTEALFEDVDYNRQLVEWVVPGLASDSWKGFAFAVEATYDPLRAKANVELLQKFDDGNSLSNMLWWIYSRPAAAGAAVGTQD